MRKQRAIQDLTGRRFGQLTVLRFAERTRHGATWATRCDCGTEKEVLGYKMLSGLAVSCGCKKGRRTHGLSATPIAKVWTQMIQRCTNSRLKEFKNYGGRGIVVCARWLASLEAFVKDMGPQPSPRHTVERMDNDGAYTPENCRWATRRDQNRNYRRNRRITHNGVTLPMVDMARKHGLQPNTLRTRLDRGWPLWRAVTPAAKRSSTRAPASS